MRRTGSRGSTARLECVDEFGGLETERLVSRDDSACLLVISLLDIYFNRGEVAGDFPAWNRQSNIVAFVSTYMINQRRTEDYSDERGWNIRTKENLRKNRLLIPNLHPTNPGHSFLERPHECFALHRARERNAGLDVAKSLAEKSGLANVDEMFVFLVDERVGGYESIYVGFEGGDAVEGVGAV